MIRALIFIGVLFCTGNAFGQSNLPPCQGSDFSKWTNCFGTRTDPSGAKYIGEFKNGRPEGQGTESYVDGDKYVGEWRDGNYNGNGTYTHAYGHTYVGEFKYRRRSGFGTLYGSDGMVLYARNINEGSRVTTLTNQQSNSSTESELSKLRLEAEESKRIQAELEEKLRISQQQNSPTISTQSIPPTRLLRAHALVIGNAAYAGSGRLDNPVNDAKSISAKLRGMGFTVTEIVDANRSRLVSSLAQFSRTAAHADMTLLFYSGHGVQIFGTNYVLPIDVDQSDLAQATLQGVSLNSIIEQFMPGKTKLVFLDACRTNPLMRTASRGLTKGLAPISVSEGTLISYAAKDGQEAFDGTGQKNSPFTSALLDHLSDPDDIAVVLRKVRSKVLQSTGGKQQPWEYGSLTGGALVLSAIKPR